LTRALTLALFVVCVPAGVAAQEKPCRFICELEWKVEPTFTIEHLANRHRVVAPDDVTERVNRERVFEMVLALDLATRVRRLGFTIESIFAPASDDNVVELEFETNLHLLTGPESGGWISSHFDVVAQLSPAERPEATRAYTPKLDLEWDTAFHVFNWLPDSRWLHGVEVETSLDYLASGIPRKGDVFSDGTRYLDNASRWSLSFVFVLPVAPF
jgi:hypothetical protein